MAAVRHADATGGEPDEPVTPYPTDRGPVNAGLTGEIVVAPALTGEIVVAPE
jgi:hypothetical protein